MKDCGPITAEFSSARYATAAIDWFQNQALAPEAIDVLIVAPGQPPRPPRRGDNARDDLRWLVSVNLDRSAVTRRVAIDAMRREGGKLVAR